MPPPSSEWTSYSSVQKKKRKEKKKRHTVIRIWKSLTNMKFPTNWTHNSNKIYVLRMVSNLALQRPSPRIHFLCFQLITCSVCELVIPKKDIDFLGNPISASCRARNKNILPKQHVSCWMNCTKYFLNVKKLWK